MIIVSLENATGKQKILEHKIRNKREETTIYTPMSYLIGGKG